MENCPQQPSQSCNAMKNLHADSRKDEPNDVGQSKKENNVKKNLHVGDSRSGKNKKTNRVYRHRKKAMPVSVEYIKCLEKWKKCVNLSPHSRKDYSKYAN